MQNKFKTLLIILGLFALSFNITLADNPEKVLDYKSDLIIDSDLDGLTDLGEKEIFKTDSTNPDTDSDGFYDGTEIIEGFNPLENTSPVAVKTITQNTFPVEGEIQWVWYLTRATGLMAFLLLYVVMFLGISIRMPGLNKIIKPIDSLNIHGWLSVQALIFVFIHGAILLLDKYLSFNILDILVPWYSKSYSNELALGIVGMYLMIILTVTSYMRKIINFKVWRAIHFLNIFLYGAVVFHGLYLGTDLREGMLRSIFIYINLALVILIFAHMIFKIVKYFKRELE